MKNIVTFAVVLLVAVSVWPSATSASRYPDSYWFGPCWTLEGGVAKRAQTAMVSALRSRGWDVESVDSDTGTIVATVCRLSARRACATLWFQPDATGAFSARVVDASVPERQIRDDVHRWMGFLDKTYSELRCVTGAAMPVHVPL